MSLSYDLLVIGPGMAGVTAADKCVAEGGVSPKSTRYATATRVPCTVATRNRSCAVVLRSSTASD